MKKILLILGMIILAGCSYSDTSFQDVVDDPALLLKDPHFANHQEQLDELESSYLRKEISYAQYLEEKKRLNNTYDREVKHRRDVIESH